MKSQSKWEQFIDKLKSLPQLFCKHDYVFSTMDELKQLNWDRISGSINCPKCGHYSNIYIPKDDEERTNYCQLLTPASQDNPKE